MPRVKQSKPLWGGASVPHSPSRGTAVSTTLTRHSRPDCRPTPQPKTIVWIDDYEPGLALYKLMFEAMGYRVLTASRGSAGIELARLPQVDAVVTDYEMPEMNGEAVVAELKKVRPSLPIVLFTGSSSIPDRLLNLVDSYCDKAESRETLIGAIQTAIQPQKLSRSATPVYAA